MRHSIKRPAYINRWTKINKVKTTLKFMNKWKPIYQKWNILKNEKCSKPNEKVLTD